MPNFRYPNPTFSEYPLHDHVECVCTPNCDANLFIALTVDGKIYLQAVLPEAHDPGVSVDFVILRQRVANLLREA